MSLSEMVAGGEIILPQYRTRLREMADRVYSLDRFIWESHDERRCQRDKVIEAVGCEDLKYIDGGHGRYAFELPSSWTTDSEYDFVVKLPGSSVNGWTASDGKKQNETELQAFEDLFVENDYPDEIRDVFCPIADYDDTSSPPKWIVMPKGGKPGKPYDRSDELFETLRGYGYTADNTASSVMEFGDRDFRFVDLGTGVIERDTS